MALKSIFIKLGIIDGKKTQKGLDNVDKRIKNIAKSAIKAGAAFFGGRAIISGLQKSIELGGKFQGVETGFNNLAKSAGFSAQAFDKFKDATDGTMGSIELMTQANNAMLLGITDSEDQMAEMFDVAQRLAQGLGKDTAFGIESLVTGLGRQSKLMLDNLGIMIDVEKANADYAASLNKSASSLTDQEKKQAFVNAAMESGRRLVQQMGDEQLTMASAIDQARSAAADAGIQMGETLSPIVTSIASKFAGAATAVANYMKELRLATTDITEMTSAEEKEEILLAKIAAKRNQILNIGLQLDEMITGDKGVHRKKLENELLQLQVQLVKAVNAEKEKELETTVKKIAADGAALTSLQEGAKSQADALDIKRDDVLAGEEQMIQWGKYLEQMQEKAKAMELENDNLNTLKQVYPELAQKLGLISSEEDKQKKIKEDKQKLIISELKQAALVQGSAMDAMKAVVRAESMEAAAGYIASIFKSVPFPLNLVAAAGAGAIVSGIIDKGLSSFAKGGDFVTDGPQMMMVGDNPGGRERVQVSPLSSPNINGPQGGVTVNVSGGIVQEDYIRNELIPALNKANSMGS